MRWAPPSLALQFSHEAVARDWPEHRMLQHLSHSVGCGAVLLPVGLRHHNQ